LKNTKGNLESLFNPKSIAMVGVSKTPGKLGYEVMNNLLKCGFRGPIYPISHRYSEVQDIRSYKSVLDVTDEIDLAVVSAPESYVPKILEELGAKGVRSAIILSGRRMSPLREAISEVSRKHGMRILGPSSLGVYYPKNRINVSPVPLNSGGRGIALISESKTLGISMIDFGISEGFEFSAVVGTGGKADIEEEDLLSYLSEDDDTKSIMIHMETLGDQKKFMESVREALKRKPIIIVTGSAEIRRKLEPLRKEIPITNDFIAAFDIAAAFLGKEIRGKRVLVVSNSSGAGNLLVESLENTSLEIPNLSDASIDDMRIFMPEGSFHRNPIDLTPEASPEIFRGILESSMNSSEIDLIILIYCGTNPMYLEKLQTMLLEMRDLMDKPVIPVFLGGDLSREVARRLRRDGIPSYVNIANVGKALDFAARYFESH